MAVAELIPPRRAQRLRRSDPSGPGYARRRCGKGFEYLDEDGDRVTDAEVVARITALVIPQVLMRLIIVADSVLASSHFFAAWGFEELCHDLRDRIVFREEGRTAVGYSGRSPQHVHIVHPKMLL